jgi:aspartate/methionine/tyrosine aminotransferase
VRESNGFRLDPADLKKAISEKSKLIIINSTSNPTAALIDKHTMREIAEIAMRNKIFVLSDEPYEKMVYDGKKHVSIGALEGMKTWPFQFSRSRRPMQRPVGV